MEVRRSGLQLFGLDHASRALVFLVPKHLPAFQRHASPGHTVQSRGLKEVVGRLFILGLEDDGGVGGGGHILFESSAHPEQLRDALHREEEGGVRAARGVQDVGEVLVAEGSELVEDDAEDRASRFPVLLAGNYTRRRRPLVPLAHDELEILQQHLAQGPDRLGVLVHVQADEEDQVLVDDVVNRKRVLVGTGNDRELVVEEGHALIQQTLNLRHPLPVVQGLVEVLDRHLEIEAALGRDGRVA